MDLPSELIDAFRENRAAVFVGAGASVAAGLPNWDDLIVQLAREMKISISAPPLSPEIRLSIPQYYINRSDSRRDLNRWLERHMSERRAAFLKTKPTLSRPIHHYLAQLPTNLYYTTNFDTFLEDELAAQDRECDVVDCENMARQQSERRRCQVRKIHGSIERDWNDIVLTRTDYACLEQNRPILFQALSEDLKAHVFLFVGFSLRDPDFVSVYNNVLRTMQGKHQTHYVALVDDPEKYEIEDLHRRGLVPIEVWNYPGGDRTQKCLSFLDSLVDATSDQVHLRRFYRGVEPHDSVPIIITSRLHETEHYVLYPACDINTANQIKEDLQKLGVYGAITPDEFAIRDPDHFLSDNVVLVCSPSGNRFTKYVFDQDMIQPVLRVRFEESVDPKYIESADEKRFYTDDPGAGVRGDWFEHGVIARYQNPWAPGKHIFVFAGILALGTHAVGEFLRRPDSYRQLTNTGHGEDIVAVLPIHFTEDHMSSGDRVLGTVYIIDKHFDSAILYTWHALHEL